MNIVVTRPENQADALCHLIEQQGWNAIRFPTLQIIALKNDKIKQQIESIYKYDWLIFISVNAVNFAISANNGKIDDFRDISIAAIGKATAKALKSAGLSVDLIPETEFNSAGLLAAGEMNFVAGKTCMIVRGKGGLETLANGLRERGATVEYMEVYRREKPNCIDKSVIDLLKKKKINVITLTSGETLKNILALINKDLHADLFLVPIIVVSNRLKRLAEQFGFKNIAVSKDPGNRAIIETALAIQNSTTK